MVSLKNLCFACRILIILWPSVGFEIAFNCHLQIASEFVLIRTELSGRNRYIVAVQGRKGGLHHLFQLAHSLSPTSRTLLYPLGLLPFINFQVP